MYLAMQPLIRTDGLAFVYHDSSGKDIRALNDINIQVHAGEFIAIIGANGSGKSTLARHLNGLLLPTEGNVLVNGDNTRQPANWRDIRHHIAMVFQHPESQAVATTVEEDVAFGPENLGIASDEIRRRVDWALEVVGLAGFQKRAPHHLSGGQKQRLALAGVLAMQPRCIVLDEATSMLDPAGRRGLRDIIRQLHNQGVSIIMITQDMDEAALADRVIVLSQGQIVRDDVTKTVMVDEMFLQSVGLDLPSITRLATDIHKLYPNFPNNLLAIDEVIDHLRQLSRIPAGTILGREGDKKYISNHRGEGQSIEQIKDLPGNRKNAYIRAHDLHYTYMQGTPLETEALRGVDFTVNEGDRTGLIGATGSGKSTLLQHLNALLTPQTGDLRIANNDIRSKKTDLREIRQQVALLFQQPEDQLFERYVADDIAYGSINLGLPLSEVRKRVELAMEAVGLPLGEFRDRSIYALSGGERRRVALAGVLALEPKVLVLDEASAGLDPRGRQGLLELLKTWQAQGDRAIVWASHSMDEVANIAEWITVMDDGCVLLSGSPRDVFNQDEILASSGLEIPMVVQVIRNLNELGFEVKSDVLTIDEAAPLLASVMA